MKKCIITQTRFSIHDDEDVGGSPVYLIETGGYGANWSRLKSDAKEFRSKAVALRYIADHILHNAKVEVEK